MASNLYKGRMIMVMPQFNEKTGEWTVEVELSRRFEPGEKFTSQEAAEKFGLKFAEAWIDKRPS
jgi:hypothetical protein